MPDPKPIRNVLFLCTGNSARSIMAEAIMNRDGLGRFRAYSAGSYPKGTVHPIALEILKGQRHDVSSLRSKSWEEFATPDAPKMDFVFTVCDNAASEVCPVWPGQPMTAHWGLPDPADFVGGAAETKAVFLDTYRMLSNRIMLLMALPLASIDKLSLQTKLNEIGSRKDNAA
jgi:protein-tyrosine-phosphatase